MAAGTRDGPPHVACSCGCLRHRSAVERFSAGAKACTGANTERKAPYAQIYVIDVIYVLWCNVNQASL